MSTKKKHYRVAIIGSGPAGWTAALYASRAELQPIVIAGSQPGGQLTITTEVENYPGFVDGILGPELMDIFRAQAERFGTEVAYQVVTDIDMAVKPFRLTLDSGDALTADALIIATGATAKLIGIPSEAELMGYGVSACATCDGFFFKGKEVIVVGGGDTAMEEATFLTKFASKVTVVHRRDEFRASRIMLERARQNPKIAWQLWKSVTEIVGEKGNIRAVRLKDERSGDTSEYPAQGVFIAIGHKPNTEVFAGKLESNDVGYLRVKSPSTATSVDGVFAAGDVCDPTYRQAVSAAGEGCKAAIDAERWLSHRGSH